MNDDFFGLDDIFIINFDKTMEFEKYFPLNNANIIISKYNTMRKKNFFYRKLMNKKKTYVRKKIEIYS
jgi:hypothetical protein